MRKLVLIFFSLISLYLFVSYYWALSVSENAIRQYTAMNADDFSLTKAQTESLIKVEDPSFWSNSGIDISSPGQGKTTLTQVTVPILLYKAQLKGLNQLLQKVYKFVWYNFKKIDIGRDVMALALHKKITKDQILKIFTEQVYMGNLDDRYVIGFKQASKIYYSKEINELNNIEFAGLISMLKSPDFFNPIKNSSSHQERTQRVLNLLADKCKPTDLFDTTYNNCR